MTFFGQLGYTFAETVLTAVNVNGVVPLGTDAVTQGFITVGPAVAIKVWGGLSIEATFDFMVWARSNSPGPGASLGLSYQGSVKEEE